MRRFFRMFLNLCKIWEKDWNFFTLVCDWLERWWCCRLWMSIITDLRPAFSNTLFSYNEEEFSAIIHSNRELESFHFFIKTYRFFFFRLNVRLQCTDFLLWSDKAKTISYSGVFNILLFRIIRMILYLTWVNTLICYFILLDSVESWSVSARTIIIFFNAIFFVSVPTCRPWGGMHFSDFLHFKDICSVGFS